MNRTLIYLFLAVAGAAFADNVIIKHARQSNRIDVGNKIDANVYTSAVMLQSFTFNDGLNYYDGSAKLNDLYANSSGVNPQFIAGGQIQFDGNDDLIKGVEKYWIQVGGDEIRSSWVGSEHQRCSASFATNGAGLYVGLGDTNDGSDVWMYSGALWSQIGGDGIGGSWTDATFAYSLCVYSNDLYVGLAHNMGDADVWRRSGTNWTQVGGDGINGSWLSNQYVYCMREHTGTLLVGIGGDSPGYKGQLWQWAGATWAHLAGNTNSSWNTDYEYVTSIEIYSNDLYVGLGVSGGDADVWKYSGGEWSQIGGDSTNSSWATNVYTYYYVQKMAVYQGALYAALASISDAGAGTVWRWNNTAWSLVAGNGTNGSWSSNVEAVHDLCVIGSRLWAGLGSDSGNGTVWVFDGTRWRTIGFVSEGYEYLYSFIAYNDSLFAGTGIGNGDADVYCLLDYNSDLNMSPVGEGFTFVSTITPTNINAESLNILACKRDGLSGDEWQFAIYQQHLRPAVFGAGDASKYVIRPGASTLTNGGTYKIAFVYTSSDTNIVNYVNGAEDNAEIIRSAGWSAPICSTNPITIGGFWDSSLLYGGKIDSIRIFNRALSSNEIAVLTN